VKPQDHIPSLQATAATVLPGMRQARALLDVSIRVLEYFERHAARDAATGTRTTFKPAEPSLQKEVENVKAMLRAFGRLHETSN
jgi:hypothetical protein